MAELKDECDNAEEQANALKARYKALRFLLKEQIISTTEAKVAVELKGKEASTLDHLQKSTFLSRYRVIEVLEKLEKRDVLRFDRKSGQVAILKTIDL